MIRKACSEDCLPENDVGNLSEMLQIPGIPARSAELFPEELNSEPVLLHA